LLGGYRREIVGRVLSLMDGNRNRLQHELIALFGRNRVEMAEALDVVDLDLTAPVMDAVQAADALLKVSGQPHRQRELVDGLDDTTAFVLCMWLLDTGFAGQFYGQAA